jgi:hypothetical protein
MFLTLSVVTNDSLSQGLSLASLLTLLQEQFQRKHGTYVACATREIIQIIEYATGRLAYKIQTKDIQQIEFISKSLLLVLRPDCIDVWNIGRHQVVNSLELPQITSVLVFGQTIIIHESRGLCSWSLVTGERKYVSISIQGISRVDSTSFLTFTHKQVTKWEVTTLRHEEILTMTQPISYALLNEHRLFVVLADSIEVYENRKLVSPESDDMTLYFCKKATRLNNTTVIVSVSVLFGDDGYFLYDGNTFYGDAHIYFNSDTPCNNVTVCNELIFHGGRNVVIYDAKTMQHVKTICGPFSPIVNVAVI